ncbi:MAG: hypothetical protein BWY83_03272 [bacterium ADurb.Bin478]|nr:MAG: hypothetical protein BWY83_03272 [bacterium ADurb.Bin478]
MVALQVMDVVGGHYPDAHLLRQLQDAGAGLILLRQRMILHFKIKIRTKDIPVFSHRRSGFFLALVQKPPRHFTLQAGAERHQSVVMRGQQLFVDAGFVVKALGVAGGDQPHKIFVAVQILAQQHQMKRGSSAAVALPELAAAGRDIDLGTDQRFDARFFTILVKFDGAVQVAVIGQSQRRHTELFGGLDQIVDAASAIQKAVMRMIVQMDKGAHENLDC